MFKLKSFTFFFLAGPSRIFRVIGINHVRNSNSLFEKENSLYKTHNLIFNRCLSNKTKDDNNLDIHAELYKPSTVKEKQHVPDDLKGGQPPETINTTVTSTTIGEGKVW